MPQPQPSEQEMRDYLASHNVTNKQKQLSQLRRVYRGIKKQIEMGLEPSVSQAYGHEKQPFVYTPREKNQLATFRGFFTIEQIRKFVKRSTMQNFTFRVYGIPKEESPKRKEKRLIDYAHPAWLTIGPRSREFVEYAMNNTDNPTDFINELADIGQEFHDVFEIVIVDTRSIRP